MNLDEFFAEHEQDEGPVGSFIRSAILMKDLIDAGYLTNEGLKESVEADLLIQSLGFIEEESE